MNFAWMAREACPIVEFHDVRTEKFKTDKYLSLIEDRLAGPLLAAGGTPLGHFAVDDHPDRLILLRGFADVGARRRALTAFHQSPEWAAERREASELVRHASVSLTRAIKPADGIRPLGAGQRVVALISEVRFAEQIGNYHLWLRLLLRKAGLDPFAAFATLEAVNDVPAIPVVRDRHQHIVLMAAGGPLPELPRELRGMLRFPPETLVLAPARSLVW